MSIQDNYAPDKNTGDGSTVEFTGNWSPLVASFMRVYLEEIATGIQTLQTLGSDYTLTFDDDGYVVTMGTAPTSDYYIIRARNVDINQSVPFRTSKGFQGYVHEDALDKLTAICQDLQEQVDRAVKIPIASGEPPDVIQLLEDAAEATAADVVLTNADVVTTGNNVDLTNADVVSSGLNVDYAEEWAINPEDDPVSVAAGGDDSTTFSALHWAAKSADSAASATVGNLFALTTAAPATDDFLAFSDTNDSNTGKKATVTNTVLAGLAGAAADIAVNSQKITSLADPADAQDAATKAYVDAEIAGIPTDVIKTVKKQVFTSSGTYTPSAGMIFCEVEAKGGGAAGGGAVSSGGTTANNNNGGGGGEGAFVKSVLTSTDIGVSKAVSIGTASSTSLGALVVAVAGSAGSAGTSGRNGDGGLGGNAASCTGDLKIGGADGSNGCGAGTSAGGSGGTGGGSGAGRGGNAASNAADNGDDAQANSGSGGGGAVSNAASTASGGAGSAGYMIIIEYCTE